jgi:biopolymer transport protein ExbB
MMSFLDLPRDLSLWGMFLSADWMVKAVMIGLAFASVVTWTVALVKGLELLLARRHALRLLDRLGHCSSLAEAGSLADDGDPAGRLLSELMLEARLSNGLPRPSTIARVDSRLERVQAAAMRRIQRGTGILATIGSTAPFVGLFGTVWGIMNSFIGISKAQTTNLAVVAPGIAEALLATAFGLAAAIPAVVIYNLFARAIAQYRAALADIAAEASRLLSRTLDRSGEALAQAAE